MSRAPPPSKRGPSVRKADTKLPQPLLSLNRLLPMKLSGSASNSQKLIAKKDVMNNIKLSLLSYDDSRRAMQGYLPPRTGVNVGSPHRVDTAAEALQFAAATRQSALAEFAKQEAMHEAMPEMARVRTEMEVAKRRPPPAATCTVASHSYGVGEGTALPSVHQSSQPQLPANRQGHSGLPPNYGYLGDTNNITSPSVQSAYRMPFFNGNTTPTMPAYSSSSSSVPVYNARPPYQHAQPTAVHGTQPQYGQYGFGGEQPPQAHNGIGFMPL